LSLCYPKDVWSKDLILARFVPKQRSPALSPIQKFKGCHFYTFLITIIVGELGIRKTLIPTLIVF
jgi:hypothetical protein